MSERCHIRVSMSGNEVRRELLVDGVKIADLSFVEALELAMQVTSSLRYETSAKPPA